jgi:lipopolysaccharide transport system ATP-binding protein
LSAPAAIECEGLGKRYRLASHPRSRSLREVLSLWVRSSAHNQNGGDLWALRDVSFSLGRGEALGVVGANGAGKSTLLKVLTRITAPTTGFARLHGRVGSLLEVGTGFHSELTGGENIFLGGAVLGLRRREILARFDEIVAFAEVERFLETPLKHYSSGMQMRLAFAVAAHLEPEILFIDEVLAVGDLAFQKKCLGRMAEVTKEGRTIVFVSHNLAAVESLCGRALLLEAGKIVRSGRPSDVIREYMRVDRNPTSTVDLSGDLRRRGTGEIRLVSAEISGLSSPGPRIRCGEGFRVRLGYCCPAGVRNPAFSLALYTPMAVGVFAVHTSDHGLSIPSIEGTGHVELEVQSANLMPGRYFLHLAIGDEVSPHRYDHLMDVAVLDVESADVYGSGRLAAAGWSLVYLPCRWSIVPDKP